MEDSTTTRPDGETTMPRGKGAEMTTTADLLDQRPTSEVEDLDALHAVRAHRPVVVRRLVERGLSPAAIDQILPGWSEFTEG